jgi:gluconolactonase
VKLLGIALLVAAASVPAQDFESVRAEPVATNLRYADGMAWSHDGFLLFADIGKKQIFRVAEGQKPQPTDAETKGAQGLAIDTQGRVYFCEPGARRIMRLDRRGKYDVIAEAFQGKKLNAPNDIVVRKDGSVYFTDPAFAAQIDTRELDFNGIFHITPKGDIELVAKWATRPNGIALSADGKTLFVTDSDRHAVVAFDLDARTGTASNQRDVVKNIEGVPGGLRADVNGKLYVAAKGLAIYGNDGRLVYRLMPDNVFTNCAFGDADFETLFAATRKEVYRIHLGVKGAVQY